MQQTAASTATEGERGSQPAKRQSGTERSCGNSTAAAGAHGAHGAHRAAAETQKAAETAEDKRRQKGRRQNSSGYNQLVVMSVYTTGGLGQLTRVP
eukprot:superscaffoldBa00001094_g8935